MPSRLPRLAVTAAFTLLLFGCYSVRPSGGGGRTGFTPPRRFNAADVALPAGYCAELVASGFTFPTGIAFDRAGTPFVTEAGAAPGAEGSTAPRLVRVNPGGQLSTVATGGDDGGSWNGVTFADGAFFVSADDAGNGGRILRVTPGGTVRPITPPLPGTGDHRVSGPLADGRGGLYFGVGTATNSGVVGPDNARAGWLLRHPEAHDRPPRDVVLSGANFVSENPLRPGETVTTGAFQPLGVPARPGQVVRGQTPGNGAVYRVSTNGGPLRLVAWGFRDPAGLALAPGGRLFVTNRGYDVRGSRPVFGAGDHLFAVTPGRWHGWPDFSGAQPVDTPVYKVIGKPQPPRLLARLPNAPPAPAAEFGVYSNAGGLDFSRRAAFGHVGDAFVALSGDLAPWEGKTLHPVGYRVVRVEAGTGAIHDFASNKGRFTGPASKFGGAGFERPVDARFNPAGDALYVVDFGVVTVSADGPAPRPGTGALWRITRVSAANPVATR